MLKVLPERCHKYRGDEEAQGEEQGCRELSLAVEEICQHQDGYHPQGKFVSSIERVTV